MAHELLIEGGRAAMFYVDEVPWHGLGTRLADPPSSEEAIRAAGLDWRVVKVPLYIAGGSRLHEVKDRFAVLRKDTIGQPKCPVFGIAGREYEPLQNADAFEFFDPIVREGRAAYETAGALGDGERVWILARLKGEMHIQDGDVAKKYLLLSNSHDGTSSLVVKFTPVRVVCNNTLTLALQEGGTVRVRHDRDVRRALDQAAELMGVFDKRYAELEQLFQRMAATRVAVSAVQKYLTCVFPGSQNTDDQQASKRTARLRALAFHLSQHGKGNVANDASSRTIWTAYNSVTELVDHRKHAERGPDFTSRRLHSVWFGQGAALKARAFRLAAEWLEHASSV